MGDVLHLDEGHARLLVFDSWGGREVDESVVMLVNDGSRPAGSFLLAQSDTIFEAVHEIS